MFMCVVIIIVSDKPITGNILIKSPMAKVYAIGGTEGVRIPTVKKALGEGSVCHSPFS